MYRQNVNLISIDVKRINTNKMLSDGESNVTHMHSTHVCLYLALSLLRSPPFKRWRRSGMNYLFRFTFMLQNITSSIWWVFVARQTHAINELHTHAPHTYPRVSQKHKDSMNTQSAVGTRHKTTIWKPKSDSIHDSHDDWPHEFLRSFSKWNGNWSNLCCRESITSAVLCGHTHSHFKFLWMNQLILELGIAYVCSCLLVHRNQFHLSINRPFHGKWKASTSVCRRMKKWNKISRLMLWICFRWQTEFLMYSTFSYLLFVNVRLSLGHKLFTAEKKNSPNDDSHDK